MRIAHLITRIDAGGSAVNTLLCACLQAERGDEVWLVHGPLQPMPAKERETVDALLARLAGAGGKRIVVRALRREIGVHDLAALVELYRTLRRIRPDLIHLHTSKAGALGRIAGMGIAPIVHTPHGHVFGGYFPRWKERLFLAIERMLAPRAKRLVALTETEKREQLALGIGRAEQWRVVPSGVDVDGIRERAQALAAETPKDFLAVSVGRLVPVKGMDRLLRVWREVVRRKPEARLAIVGEGPERERLAMLAARWGIAEQVVFAGFADPLPWLVRARVFALFSRNEGQGRALVEALAAGLPAVVGGAPALAEVGGDAARVVDPEDPAAAAEAFLAPWPEDIAARAWARAKLYSIEAMMEALDAVYREALA
ncbi:MAG: glycosyltransferase [Zetaproteobacteria bacterium]|nr:MAG: glycosyltransferase [Zetaproteobacteria bacterium]